jgi:hypothetical protein
MLPLTELDEKVISRLREELGNELSAPYSSSFILAQLQEMTERQCKAELESLLDGKSVEPLVTYVEAQMSQMEDSKWTLVKSRPQVLISPCRSASLQ